LNKAVILILILPIVLGGCTGHQSKTKEQLVNEGIKFNQQNDPGAAVILFKKALEKDPNYFEARFLLAKSYYAVGKINSAEKELQKVRRQNPSSRDVQIEIARVMVHTKRADDALKELKNYLGDESTDCDAMDIAGWAHAVKKDYTGAITLLKKAIVMCKGLSTPSISLATVYVMMGNTQEAEAHLMQILEKEPTSRTALYLLSDIQAQQKDRAAALKTLERLVQTNPNDSEAQYRKGLLYVESGDYERALALSREIVKQTPYRPEGHRLQGFIHFYKKQYSDAIASLQTSVLMQPYGGAYYVLGLSHYYRNETEQAMNQFQKALDINPFLTRARVHYAIALLNKKRVDDAIKELKRVLAQDNDDAFAHNILGSAYLAKGNYEDGMAELNRALALDPSLANVHVKKGLLAMQRGKGREAEYELAAAVRIKPEAQDARRILVLYYINNDQSAKAIEVLKKDIQSGNSDAVSYYLMAESYLRQNNRNEATAYYQKAKEVDPKYELAYLRLAAMYFEQDKQEQSARELRSLVEHAPGNVQALLMLASMAELNGDAREALKVYLQAADTGKTGGVIAAARYLQRINNSEKALTILNESIKRAPTDDNLYYLKGKILLKNKKFKDALSTFETIERRNPQLGPGLLVDTYLAMGEHAKALEKVRTEIEKYPTNLDLRAEFSKIYLSQGNKTEAVENAHDIINNNPESSIGYMTLALVYQNSGDIDKAIESLREASRINDANLAVMLGNLYALKKNYVAALEQCRKAESMKAGSDQIPFQKATILYAMGSKKEAEAEYQRVLQLSPNHAMALNNLAYLYAEENKHLSQALTYATRAFILEPQNDYIRDTLGYVLLKNGKFDRGERILRKAAESSPKNPTIIYHLALVYKESGNSAKAVEHLQRALELGDFPADREARTLLEKIRKDRKS
jgi:putative PEP-CTERM system TPR-repeat lipoprotein